MLQEFYINENKAFFIALNEALNSFAGLIFWRVVTLLGDGLVVAAIALLLAGIARKSTLYRSFAISALSCVFIVQLLKIALDVDRPLSVLNAADFYQNGGQYYYHAFPSGHTATAFFTAFFLYRAFDSRFLPGIVFFAGALLVGLSRIALGVHWPGDVLTGALVGVGCGWLGFRGFAQKNSALEPSSFGDKWFRIVFSILCIVSFYHLFIFSPFAGEESPEIYLRRGLAVAALAAAGGVLLKVRKERL